jgi:hypothetical protein
MRPKKPDESEELALLESFFQRRGLEVYIDKMLLIQGEDHFLHFKEPYANGYTKQGTIRYRQNKVRLPFGAKLPVYESNEYQEGKSPRGIIIIGSVVRAPLNELSMDEILMDGFNSKGEMLWDMTKNPNRCYKDLKPYSEVSYYYFKEYNPKPSNKELQILLRVLGL